MENSYRYFCNRDCQYFPCHTFDSINCLFCFCPLYGYECGGDFDTLPNGIKDCSSCGIPHRENGYSYIIDFLKDKFKKEVVDIS